MDQPQNCSLVSARNMSCSCAAEDSFTELGTTFSRAMANQILFYLFLFLSWIYFLSAWNHLWLSGWVTKQHLAWKSEEWLFFLALFPVHFCPNTKHVLPPLFPSISSRLQGRESAAVAIGDALMMCKDRKTWWKTFYTHKPCKHHAGARQRGGAGPTWCFMWGLQPPPALQAGLEPLNKRRDQRQESVQTSFYN